MKLTKKIILLLGLVSIGGLVTTTANGALIKMGDQPKLVVTDFNGNTFDLSHEKGKWVLIHFFASWCPGCKTELPEIVKLYQKYHPANLDILLLSPEPGRKKSEVKDFIKTYPMPAALIADTKTNDFGSAMDLPTSYLIDKEGHVKLIFVPKENDFEVKKIEALIAN